jgi:hypothetical protein
LSNLKIWLLPSALSGEIEAIDQNTEVLQVCKKALGYHELVISHIETGDGLAAEEVWKQYWGWITPYTHPENPIVEVLQNLDANG